MPRKANNQLVFGSLHHRHLPDLKPLYGPLYGHGVIEGLVTCCRSLASRSLARSRSLPPF